MNTLEFIRDRVPREELLAQLAEEAAELGHAALKLRRVYSGTNPTPVKHSDAFNSLLEEIADVRLLLVVLGLGPGAHRNEFVKIMDAKLDRWVARLRAAEEAAV